MSHPDLELEGQLVFCQEGTPDGEETRSPNVDDLLSKLDKLGLNTPNSPYANEGRQQMRSALERLSRLLKTTE